MKRTALALVKRRFYKRLIALADAQFEARLVTWIATDKKHPRGKNK